MNKDFLHVTDWTKEEIIDFLDKAKWIKSKFKSREDYLPFKGESMAMIFAKRVNNFLIFQVDCYKIRKKSYWETQGNEVA